MAMDRLTVVNGNGNQQSMFVMNGAYHLGENLRRSEHLPPVPATGVFGARFASGKYIESVETGAESPQTIPIHLKDFVFPVKLIWSLKPDNLITYRLRLTGSGYNEIPLTGDGEIVLGEGSNVGGTIILRTWSAEPPPCDPPTRTTPSAEAVSDETTGLPGEFQLFQNHPNPFNPTTQITYALPQESHVTLKIYNALGMLVRTLVDGRQSAGYKSLTFSADALPSGIYFYQLYAGGHHEMHKMVIMK
jgi:hypothetical protein